MNFILFFIYEKIVIIIIFPITIFTTVDFTIFIKYTKNNVVLKSCLKIELGNSISNLITFMSYKISF
jgi:hypothetical protein